MLIFVVNGYIAILPANKIAIIHIKTTVHVINTGHLDICCCYVCCTWHVMLTALLVEALLTSTVVKQTGGSVGDEACASLPVTRLKRLSSLRAEMTSLSKPPRLLQSIKQAGYCPQLICKGGGGPPILHIALLKMRIG